MTLQSCDKEVVVDGDGQNECDILTVYDDVVLIDPLVEYQGRVFNLIEEGIVATDNVEVFRGDSQIETDWELFRRSISLIPAVHNTSGAGDIDTTAVRSFLNTVIYVTYQVDGVADSSVLITDTMAFDYKIFNTECALGGMRMIQL